MTEEMWSRIAWLQNHVGADMREALQALLDERTALRHRAEDAERRLAMLVSAPNEPQHAEDTHD